MQRSRRVLSTWATLPVKWLFPLCWSLGWGAGTAEMLAHPETTPYNGVPGAAPPGYGWFMLALWVLGTAFVSAFGWGLKRVILDGDVLVVSNYLRRVRVPLADVASVRRSRFPHNGGVEITLAHPTAFGRRVRFVAGGRYRGIDGLVADLETRVRAAQSPPCAGQVGHSSAQCPAGMIGDTSFSADGLHLPGVAALVAVRVGDLERAFVEAAEHEWPERHVPYASVDLLEADVLLTEHVAHVHPRVVPAHAAVAAHTAHLPVGRVLERRQACGVGSWRRGVPARRGGLA